MVPLLLVPLLAPVLFGVGFAVKILWWVAPAALVLWLVGRRSIYHARTRSSCRPVGSPRRHDPGEEGEDRPRRQRLDKNPDRPGCCEDGHGSLVPSPRPFPQHAPPAMARGDAAVTPAAAPLARSAGAASRRPVRGGRAGASAGPEPGR